jgi:O-antigen/teichoic acid export membrane protein
VGCLLFAKAVALVLGYLVPLLLVRRFSQAEFGLYKQLFLVAETAIAVLPLGLGGSIYFFLPRERGRRNQILFNALLSNVAAGGLVCAVLAVHPTLLAALLNSPAATPYALLMGFVVLALLCCSSFETILIANDEIRLAMAYIVAAQLGKALLYLTAVLEFHSVVAIAYAAIIHGVMQTSVLLCYLQSRFPGFWRGFEWPMLRAQLTYAVPFGVSSLIYSFYSTLDNYVVSYRFGASAYAIYAVGCFNLPLIPLLLDSLGATMIPQVSRLENENQRREIVELTARMMRKLAAICLPLYVFLLVIGPEFITLLFTSRYLASWPILAINLTLIPLSIVTSAYDPIMRAHPSHRFFLVVVRATLLGALFVALWFGTRYLGLVGAIAIAVVANVLERMIVGIKAGRILRVGRHDLALLADIPKFGAAAVLAGAVTLLVRAGVTRRECVTALVGCGIVFWVAYPLIVLLLGILSEAERHALSQWLTSLYDRLSWRRVSEPRA